MKNYFHTVVFRFAIAAITLLIVSGCDSFDPATDEMHTNERPLNVFAHGVWWVPILERGGDGWFFIPEDAAIVTGHAPFPPNYSVDILLNGKIWRCNKESNGSISFNRGIDPNLPLSPAAILLLIVCLTGSGVFFISANFKLGKAEKLAAAANAKEGKLLTEARQQAETKEREIEYQRTVDRSNADAIEAIRLERERLANERNTHLVAIRESKTPTEPPTRAQWESLRDVVRAGQFRGCAAGEGIIVNYLIDPTRSGALTFAWEATWNRPYAPTLLVFRDGRKIRRESGMFKNEFSSQFVRLANSHIFTFKLLDRGKQVFKPLLFEVMRPPFDAWQPEPPKPITAEQRREIREAKRKEMYQAAEQFTSDRDTLKRSKAEIDREILQKFGEE